MIMGTVEMDIAKRFRTISVLSNLQHRLNANPILLAIVLPAKVCVSIIYYFPVTEQTVAITTPFGNKQIAVIFILINILTAIS
jgi:hypothetical protein